MKKILVPVDGSEYSLRALERAKGLGEFYKAEITLLTVIYSGHFNYFESQKDVLESEEKISHDLVLEASKVLEDSPCGYKTVAILGDTAKEIITMAEEQDFYLIVIGSRGHGTFARALLGSVSQKVVSHANTTVMVVR